MRLQYILTIGDQRYLDVNTLDFITSVLAEGSYDTVCLTGNGIDEDLYTSSELLARFWPSMSLLRAVIFRSSIFYPLKDKTVYESYLNVFNRNDGFSQLGIFLSLVCEKPFKAKVSGSVVQRLNRNKSRAWMRRFLEVWCSNFVYMIDQLPDYYATVKERTLKESWKAQGWTKWIILLQARAVDGINIQTYRKFEPDIKRVTDQSHRIKLISYIPLNIAKVIIIPYKLASNLKNAIKRIISKIKS